MADSKPLKTAQNICGLCNEKQSKYCCPRCNILYCSLDCYKSHKHTQCSESFYRECVNEELATYHTDDDSKHKMIDILKRMQDEDVDINDLLENESIDSDDADEVGLDERIKDLNLDDADAVWNALTEDERNEFEGLLSKGDIGAIMSQWEPWWMYFKLKKLVEDVGNHDEKVLDNCPKLKVVPELRSLTKVQPSPTIKNNITNVLASYAFIMRYYNGDIEPVEGAICLFNICANLEANTNFEDPEIAVESVAQKCLQSELIQTDEASLDVMKTDTYLILRGPSDDNVKYYCKAALSHLHQILTEAKSSQKVLKTDTEVQVKTAGVQDKTARGKDKTAEVKDKTARVQDKTAGVQDKTAEVKDKTAGVQDKTAFSRKFPEHKKENLPNLDVCKVKKGLKKIEYYLSFIESYSMDF